MHDILEVFALDGRVAVVTGASSGLGERFATVLHAAGASVVLAGRRQDRLEALGERLGTRTVVVPCDVTNDADRHRLIETGLESFGSIDILVNNAGIARGGPPAQHERLSDVDDVLDVNVRAPFALCQLVAPHMFEVGGGSIINIGSVFALVAGAPFNNASYCASKGAILSLSRELAVQWARRGVRVNALVPGYFPSEITEPLLADDDAAAYVRRNCPMGRPGRPDELDGALLFLASSASTFMTGQLLVVDGGWTAR